MGRDALGAVVLLGAIIFILSLIPASEDGSYQPGRLGRYICEVVGTGPGTPRCAAVSITGWFLIVVTVGLVLKAGRTVLKAAGGKS